MIVRHRMHRVIATCPLGGVDVYRLMVETTRLIAVEDILIALRELTRAPIYQEDLTAQLAEKLNARVVTEGEHSGVATECEAGVP
jgi:hypothetical protein